MFAVSTMVPAYMTATRSARLATTPRSWLIQIIAIRSVARSSDISARICACTVVSSAVVGSSAMSRWGSQDSAMAIIARWHMPPENWCG